MDNLDKKKSEESHFQPVCPKCSSKMTAFKLGHRCTGKTCTFWIPREIRQKVLTEKIIKDLIEKRETDVIEGFHKRGSSQTFAAKLYLNKDWKIKIRLNGETALKCPTCGDSVQRFDRGYRCNNTEKCDFVLWDRFCGKRLTPAQMEKLIKEKKTDIIHGFLRKKDGKTYSARIVMSKAGELSMEFIE
jgi:DNA topoisomerase-3